MTTLLEALKKIEPQFHTDNFLEPYKFVDHNTYENVLQVAKRLASACEIIGRPVDLDNHILSRPLENMSEANEAVNDCLKILGVG